MGAAAGPTSRDPQSAGLLAAIAERATFDLAGEFLAGFEGDAFLASIAGESGPWRSLFDVWAATRGLRGEDAARVRRAILRRRSFGEPRG